MRKCITVKFQMDFYPCISLIFLEQKQKGNLTATSCISVLGDSLAQRPHPREARRWGIARASAEMEASEAGALRAALLPPHQDPPRGGQALSLTADELLRELVEEHRDPTFEYRSPLGWRRCGKWVGGAAPIEDAKTKSRFSLLALWCAQVSRG